MIEKWVVFLKLTEEILLCRKRLQLKNYKKIYKGNVTTT